MRLDVAPFYTQFILIQAAGKIQDYHGRGESLNNCIYFLIVGPLITPFIMTVPVLKRYSAIIDTQCRNESSYGKNILFLSLTLRLELHVMYTIYPLPSPCTKPICS